MRHSVEQHTSASRFRIDLQATFQNELPNNIQFLSMGGAPLNRCVSFMEWSFKIGQVILLAVMMSDRAG